MTDAERTIRREVGQIAALRELLVDAHLGLVSTPNAVERRRAILARIESALADTEAAAAAHDARIRREALMEAAAGLRAEQIRLGERASHCGPDASETFYALKRRAETMADAECLLRALADSPPPASGGAPTKGEGMPFATAADSGASGGSAVQLGASVGSQAPPSMAVAAGGPSLVVGNVVGRSLAMFERAAESYIAAEQGKPLPDNGLIATLCDAVRLSREYAASQRRRPAPTRADSPPTFDCPLCGPVPASPPIPPSEPRPSVERVAIRWSVEDGEFIATHPDWPYLSGLGRTGWIAAAELLEALSAVAMVYRDDARAALARIVGIGPGENAGSPADCTDCGRAMVWNRAPGEQGPGSSWMCPRCVLERCLKAEAALAARSGEGAK